MSSDFELAGWARWAMLSSPSSSWVLSILKACRECRDVERNSQHLAARTSLRQNVLSRAQQTFRRSLLQQYLELYQIAQLVRLSLSSSHSPCMRFERYTKRDICLKRLLLSPTASLHLVRCCAPASSLLIGDVVFHQQTF